MKSMSLYSDIELIKSFQQGNAKAFETLLHRHKNKIFTTVYFIVKDKHLAEDIFQETFVKIIDKLKANQYNEEGKFISWAARIAHNLCIDYIRRTKRCPPVVASDDNDFFNYLFSPDANAEQKMVRKQNEDRLHYMLSLLPQDQREVIVLRHFADMSFKEIASLMNCSINTALGRMRYGLINLRRMMTEKQISF